MNIYCIVDKEAKACVSFFPSVNDDTAKRSFLQLVASPFESVYSSYPEHFSLYAISDVNFNSELCIPEVTPKVRCLIDVANSSEVSHFREVLRERFGKTK